MKNLKSTKLGLKGKQSERTTFKLSTFSLILLKGLAAKNNISQKEVLIEAIKHVERVTHSPEFFRKKILADLEETSNSLELKEPIRKTLVLNKESLDALNKYALTINISRDELLNYALLYLFSETYADNALSLLDMELKDGFPWATSMYVSGVDNDVIDAVNKTLSEFPDLQKEILNDLRELEQFYNDRLFAIVHKLEDFTVKKLIMIKEINK